MLLPNTGIISESDKTITVLLPDDQDRTALTPTITHTGKSITPASGAPQDFTNPVTNTVAAEAGSQATITAEVPTLKRSFTDKEGTVISEGIPPMADNSITLEVLPYDYGAAQYRELTVDFMFGTRALTCEDKPDFRDPVAYTLTRPDGSTKEYTFAVKKNP